MSSSSARTPPGGNAAPDTPAGGLDLPRAEALLRLTRTMAAAARGGDWEAVERGDAERRELLGGAPTYRQAPLPPALIEALRAADEELLRHARDAREHSRDDRRRARVERDACRRYTAIMQSAGTAERS